MKLPRGVPLLLSVGVLVGAANLTAYAATGGDFILGKANTATRTSTLENTKRGPALSLRSRPGAAPLAVSNTRKVARLNADLLDGVDATALQTRPVVYDLNATGGQVTGVRSVKWALPDLAPGIYQVSYSVAALQESATLVGEAFVCSVADADGQLFLLGSATFYSGSGAEAFVSGAGVVDLRSGPGRLNCGTSGSDGWSLSADGIANQITLTRVDAVTERNPTAFDLSIPGGGGTS